MAADVIVEGDYYAMVPEWLLTSDFSSNAVKLYALLRRYADKSTNLAHPSRKTLADRMGFSKTATVDAPIKELVDKGAMETFIRWRKDKDGKTTGERSSNGYKLFVHRVVPKNGLPPIEGTTGSPVKGTTVVPKNGLGVVPQTGQQNHSQLEPQSVEPQSVKKASAKPNAPKTPADEIATYAYDSTSGALKYMAVKGLAKWALESKEATPDQIKASLKALYEMGKPTTRATLGQHLDGFIGGHGTRPATEDRMNDILAIGESLDSNQRQIGA